MLQLKNINKKYIVTKELSVHALKGISVNFRKNEFVSILGPSGCGKTTLLNIIGGLDKYTSGDLVINNKSTKNFKDKEWDDYRNKSIGFVFQNYNLISHQNILNNVAMGLTLAGMPLKLRQKKAKEVLIKVGLGKEIKKKPNQLSGGQMQRVAIARAIVNDPDIILADEPTGALDSTTGIQIMKLLKEISQERLVIMVTHNEDLAQDYSTRIIKIFDGKVTDDSNPYTDDLLKTDKKVCETEISEKSEICNKKVKKVKMSIPTAFALSFKTLMAKKGRTFITSFAGSIGIFAICLILAISSGMSNYVGSIESSALSGSAITISETSTSFNMGSMQDESNSGVAYPEMSGIKPYSSSSGLESVKNDLSEEYVEYLNAMDEKWTSTIEYSYSTKMNIIANTSSGYKLLTTSSYGMGGMGSLMGGNSSWYDVASQTISNSTLITDSYDALYKTNETGLPSNKNELTLVVDKYNRLSTSTLEALGIDYSTDLSQISYSDLTSETFKLILNNDYYTLEDDIYKAPTTSNEYETLYNSSNAISLNIVGILRIKNDDATEWLSSGIVYSSDLTDYVRNDAQNSNIGQAQIVNNTTNVLTGQTFTATATSTVEEQYESSLKNLGIHSNPTSISIYPVDIEAKENITEYLDAWNTNNPDNQVVYTDYSEMLLSMLSSIINIISYILIAFCAVSLIVSTVMISVTTYTSVVERTKEIGTLRSLGARKKDISRIFNSETIMIGGFAGVIGISFSAIIGGLLNLLLNSLLGVSTIVNMTWGTSIIMLLLSIGLTWLAGLIPARMASKKDPVICLRTE